MRKSLLLTALSGQQHSPYMPAALSRLMLPTGISSAVVSGSQYGCFRAGYRSPPWPTWDYRVLFFNAYFANTQASPETAIGNDTDLLGVNFDDLSAGATKPFKFSGLTTKTLVGKTFAWTDVGGPYTKGSPFPANTDYSVRWADHVAVGGVRPQGSLRTLASRFDASSVGSTDQSAKLTGTPPSSATGTSLWSPALIVAKGWQEAGRPRTGGVWGDSTDQWQNEDPLLAGTYGALGYISRGLEDLGIPHFNWSIPGTGFDSMDDVDGAGALRYAALAALGNWPAMFDIMAHLRNSAFDAAFNTKYVAIASRLKSKGAKRVIGNTCTPTSTTTDQWTTVAGQSASSASSYVACNTEALSQPAPYDACLDMRPYFWNTNTDGKYKSHGYSGTLTSALGSTGLSSLTITAGSAPIVGAHIVIDDPTSSSLREIIKVASFVDNGDGTYTITLPTSETTAKTHSAGVAIAEQTSNDGIHPTTGTNIRAKAGIIAQQALLG